MSSGSRTVNLSPMDFVVSGRGDRLVEVLRETGQLLLAQGFQVFSHQTLPSWCSGMARRQRTYTCPYRQALGLLRRGLPRVLGWLVSDFLHDRLCEGDGKDGVDQGFSEDAESAEGSLSGEEVDLQDVVGGHRPVQHGDAEEDVAQVQPDAAHARQSPGVLVGPETYGEGVPD